MTATPQPRSRGAAFVSIATTAYNEETGIPAFCAAMREQLAADGIGRYEIVVVDDGSSDGTLAALRRLNAEDPRVRYVSLSRNFGHQGGLTAAMEHCRGQVAITMDADLQHPPAMIPKLLEQWEAGFDVVHTYKVSGAHISPARAVFNRLFYRGVSTLCGMPLSDKQSDFRLLDRAALDAVNALPEKSKFLRGLTHWVGFRQTSVPYQPSARHSGHTKFSLSRLVTFAISGVLSFSVVPLRVFTLLGLAVAMGSIAYGLWALATVLLGSPASVPPGWTSLAVGMSMLGGIQLIGIGVIGEYVGRLLSEVHARPAYIVREASAPPPDQG
jgi:glycosyltransferase involved in cell wall biosynthesis